MRSLAWPPCLQTRCATDPVGNRSIRARFFSANRSLEGRRTKDARSTVRHTTALAGGSADANHGCGRLPRADRQRLLALELAAGIAHVKSAKVESASGPASGSASGRSAQPCAAPVRGGSAQRWALFGRVHAGGDGRRTACGCVESVGVVCPTSRPATKCELDGQLTWRGLTRTNRATPARTPQQCQLPDVRQSGSWAISLWHRGVAGDLDSLTGGGGSRPDACPTATAACGGWRPALPR